ncbi:MAG: hypothetical protein HYW02_07835 [Deltaproteobacteria bacterium]|nr:hypothetical protein [Deltaproteobacteria bacterium]MBI2501346.1 hypothetical protein [Deltaproteobacteria bacterium]
MDVASSNLLLFFRERIREALQKQRLKTPEGVEFYLVNLLQGFSKADELFAPQLSDYKQRPLALMMCEALQAGLYQKIALLKKVGDLSLFTAGFFPDSLKRHLVDVDYYVQMGGAAYGNLSQLMNREPAFEEIFTELASRFISYVDVLSEVSEKTDFMSDKDILRLYETWLKTGSERAKQALSEEGILPIAEVPLKNQ